MNFRILNITFVLFLFLFLQGVILAQENSEDSTHKKFHLQKDFGIGFGIDYGGLGARAGFYPIKYLGLFGSVGIMGGGMGWQLGIVGYILPRSNKKAVRPYVQVLYGINAATNIQGGSEYNGTFAGPSVGAGLELRFGKKRKHGFNFDVNYPFRSEKYEERIEAIKSDPHLGSLTEPWVILFSLGYHWEF